jgi:hypothetical protein
MLRFTILIATVLVLALAVAWWLFVRGNDSTSANFEKVGTITVNRPDTIDFTTAFFKISLPKTWEEKGRQNPFSYEVFYLYQNNQSNYDNRWLRVYVDVFPKDLPLNRLLPVTVVNGKLSPGVLSDECTAFTDAPVVGANGQKAAFAPAKWQGVSFTCNFASAQNLTGTASAEEGYGISMTGSKSGTHKYFFTYSDFNVRPDYQFLSEALKSFQAL